MNMKRLGLLLLMAFALASGTVAEAADQNGGSGSTSGAPAPDTPVNRVTGQLTHIEGWHYTIKDSRGEEVSFGVTSATQDPDKVKEGDHIVAIIGEDRIARVIKNMKKKS